MGMKAHAKPQESKNLLAPVNQDLFEAAELEGNGESFMHALRAQPFARREKAREMVTSDIALGMARKEASRQARKPPNPQKK
jgi:hypothetical protein